MAEIIYGGYNLSNHFNVFVDEAETFVVPERDVEFIEIPGLNGSLTYDNHRFKNVTIPVKCFIRENFATNFRSLMDYLLSTSEYASLYLGTDPNHYRLAIYKGGTVAKTGSFNKSGSFTLNFVCKPERWRADGQIATRLTPPTATLLNPTSFNSKPFFTLVGKGSCTVNGYSITIAQNSPYDSIDFNCELMTCYSGTNNAAKYVYMPDGFPVLKPGANTITMNLSPSNVVVITPRWYDL